MSEALTLGIDIGGTKIAGALVDRLGLLHSEISRIPTPRGPAEVIAAVIRLACKIDAGRRAVAIGVGSAGVFDVAGVVTSATDIMPGWRGTDLAGELRDALGMPAVALNDVQAAALGEGLAGAARDLPSFLMVAIGTGIGGAAVIGGQLVRGAHDVAGSIGHISVAEADGLVCSCGRTGHLEALASGPALAARYHELSGRQLVDLSELPRDAIADGVLRAAAAGLGTALAGAAAMLDPHLIVVGGGVSALGSRLLDPAREIFRDRAFGPVADVAIVPTASGAPTIVGAGAAAFDALSSTS